MEITLKLNKTDSDQVEMYVNLFKHTYLMGAAHVDNFSKEIMEKLEELEECNVKMTLIEEEIK